MKELLIPTSDDGGFTCTGTGNHVQAFMYRVDDSLPLLRV
jgi:hypothetical protein